METGAGNYAPYWNRSLHGLLQLRHATPADLTADEARRVLSSLERRIRVNEGAISGACISAMKEEKVYWLASGPLLCHSSAGQEERNSHPNHAARATQACLQRYLAKRPAKMAGVIKHSDSSNAAESE